MVLTGVKLAEDINYWIRYIDCALSHPLPLPKNKHVFHSDQRLAPEIRDLYDCLYKLYAEESASEYFREPVDALRVGAWNYYSVITEPMSLRTVLDYIVQGGRYSQVEQIMNDVELIWKNCERYNGAESHLAADARRCRAILEKHRERLADEQTAPAAEVDELIEALESMDDSVLKAVEAYFLREDPTLILSSGDVDIPSLRVKHLRAMKEIVQRAANGQLE
ncbi:Bromodomain, putative [Trypanosoma equiperdum]|uniref:Bromo domain-containing protein n=2 Tax=Trypanozoon TaxID=39700 RepID=Q383S2_TRYB2|nr:hypothetical protein, conserved [Trypanosoma brucei brucei TREU927]EAN79959.1 hypothetical protein, conserved [Trypanosoma brucei brucei TREU927]SCU72754.1 Bromodomain, putative [Trypanosoma equiperdum]